MLEVLEAQRADIVQLRRVLEEIEALAPTLRPVRLDGMPRGGGGDGDRMAETIDARDAMLYKAARLRAAIGARRAAVRAFINELPVQLYTVAIEVYANAYPVAEAAKRCGIGDSTAYERLRKVREIARRSGRS